MTLVSSISNFFISKKQGLKQIVRQKYLYIILQEVEMIGDLIRGDDLFQNLFLEMKKLEIEETKVTYFVSVLKVVYWGPFLGL